ncbi:DUF6541 family protein [Companilactobacillus kimchiensis]|nr:DUF6541 family protein [Companilactobacillus kimchiensis]
MSNRASKRTIIGVTFLVLSIFYTFLFSPYGNIRLIDSFDMLFHLNRIDSLGNILNSPVNFDYWNHVGNITSLFYPWLTISPGYLIFKIFGNPVLSFLIFLTLITFLTFISAYYFMEKYSNDTLQAVLFSIIYTLSFFRLASVFYRVGLAEYISYIFIPMVFYAFAKMLAGEFNKWPLFALGIALIIMTHPLTAFITIVMLIPLVFLVLFSKVSHSWKYWGQLILAGIQAILMVAVAILGFVLPMLEQKRAVTTNRPALLDLTQTAQKPLVLAMNSLHTDVRSYSLGIISLATLLVILLFIWKDKFAYKLVAIEAIIGLVISTSVFPWKYLQDTFFNFLQFPWRFLNLVTFFLAIYLSHILAQLLKKRSPVLKLFVLILTVAACVTQVFISGTNLNRQPSPIESVTAKNGNHYIQSFDQKDYYPVNSLKYSDQLKQHKFLVNNKQASLPFTTTPNIYLVSYYNKDSVKMDIPVLFYKGIDVSINNEKVAPKVSQRGTVQIKTQTGQNNIEISYHYTLIAKFSMLVSIIGLLILILLTMNAGFWKNLTNMVEK